MIHCSTVRPYDFIAVPEQSLEAHPWQSQWHKANRCRTRFSPVEPSPRLDLSQRKRWLKANPAYLSMSLRAQSASVVLALLILSIWNCGVTIADTRPNIVFLLADDQTTYSLGCYGTPGVETPNIDQLAKDGMVFDNHYVTTAICMASRVNIMTGMFEYKHGCNFEHGPLMQEHWAKSYPMLLRKAGYLTALAGKIGFEVSPEPGKKAILPVDDFNLWGAGPGQTFYETKKNKSMSKYAKEYPHSTLSYGAFGRDFIQASADSGRPFCLSISFKAPHKPATPDPRFDSVYAGRKFTKPANYGRQYGEHFSQQSRQGRQFERFHSWEYSSNYDEVMATYYQQIYAIDVAVGMIRDALNAAGVSENTVVIYTSDNGFMCGSHGYGSKVLPYEESSRVPLVLFDPRHENSGKQLRSGALTGNVDFAATILQLAGLPSPENMDGKSLMSLYRNPSAAIHDHLPLINVWGPRPVFSLSVVTKDWKYIFWPYSRDEFEPTEELYQLAKDPQELTNLAGQTAAKDDRSRMRRLYDNYVTAWKREVVPYNKYSELGDFFARSHGN